jgi:hypothetical protein
MATTTKRTTTKRRPPKLRLLPGDRFEARRDAALRRLVRAGVPSRKAEAWISAWDESTVALRDFRRAADFWDQGYLFALEEFRRGHDPLAPARGRTTFGPTILRESR